MKPLSTGLIVLMTAAVAFGDKKNDSRFSPGPIASYSAKQTNDGVTVATAAYDTEELAHTAFGKLNPYQYGVLPVLVIIQNDTNQSLRLDRIEVEYLSSDRSRVESTPASEVAYVGSHPKRPAPNMGGPIPPGLIKHKNPLSAWEIEARAFSARMLPPHELASGFFYFQARHLPGSRLYLTGIEQAGTGKEIFYFEIPLP
jgi:hypothetical protein